MTETPGVGFRSWVEGIENNFRNKARTVLHRLSTFALFRWQASGSPKQVAGDPLGAAFWRQSRATKGDTETPSVVRPGIVSISLCCMMSIGYCVDFVIFLLRSDRIASSR
jgi:hypothetical protein